MNELYVAARDGDLERVILLVEQGAEVNKLYRRNISDEDFEETALCVAAENGHLNVVKLLVEQGADMEMCDTFCGMTSLMNASAGGHYEVMRYLLEQGADRDEVDHDGDTPLHHAAESGHLEAAKLLMVYGADLNAMDDNGLLPIDLAFSEKIRQAIRDEPRRRMDHGHKRATEQDRHPSIAALASAQHEKEDEEQQSNKRPRLDEGAEAGEEKVEEED